jgi:hypothetical protein
MHTAQERLSVAGHSIPSDETTVGLVAYERLAQKRWGSIKMSDTPRRISVALERHWRRLGKLHCKAASAEVAPELLAEHRRPQE